MRLGILQTGHVPDDMQPTFGDYAEIFRRHIHGTDASVTLRAYAVVDGVFPEAVDACDAWLITGTKHGVYDDLPWITPLKAFLKDARAARVPMVGICFGHQIMAEAFGGRAEKSEKGWGCGVHGYQVEHVPGWMEAMPSFAMHAMHQDQVVALPEDATRLATSPFCEHAMLCYGDPEAPDAISIQPHPEFENAFAEELLVTRRGTAIPVEVVDAAISTLGMPVAGNDFAGWCLSFLRKKLRERDAA